MYYVFLSPAAFTNAWNSILAELGVGPLGIKINKLSAKRLEPKIIDLLNNQKFKENAENIKAQMAKENFKNELLKEITGYSRVGG